MKKFLAVCTAIIMVVFMCSACGGDTKPSGNSKVQKEVAPEETVTKCIEAAKEADAKGVKNYVSKESSMYEGLDKLSDIDSALAKEDGMSDEKKRTIKEIEKLAVKYLPELLKKVEYTVGKSEIKGDKATVEVEVPVLLTAGYEPSEELRKKLTVLFVKNMSSLTPVMQGEVPDAASLNKLANDVLPELLDILADEAKNASKGKIEVELQKEETGWKILNIN